ncbi:MAG: ABC transporter ATP-binding protein [Acidobacteriota bacterium]
MTETAHAVTVEQLGKHFGSATALGGIDLNVPAGQFLTVFGPNGAGKTTLMRILATLARPSDGTVRIFGEDTRHASAAVRRRIGLVTHRSLLYAALSAHENVSFFARMFGVPDAAERAAALLTELGLEHRMHDAVQTYSRGMEQRAAIARALVHDPDVLLLDEPFSGLDPDARARLRVLMMPPPDRPRTVILTSHDLTHGADLADRVAILARGHVVFDAPAGDIPAGTMGEVYRQHTGARTR